MITLHWLSEYAAVFCSYAFLMFIWPAVVFHKFLAEKSKVYRFGFCVTVQIMLVNTVVLVFGLFHILNKWTIIAFFYGVFLFSVFRRIRFSMKNIEAFHNLILGAYGKKRLLLQTVQMLRDRLKKWGAKIWTAMYARLGEYIILMVLLVFGMIYFSYGAFQDYSYGFSDMYVHHRWIYGLIEGEIFSSGVYPEAMHCFVYCLHTLFGIEVYSILLFLGGIHIGVLLISVYFLLREVFHWRYVPFFVLTMFLTVDVTFTGSMSRLQCTLPQEFGMYTEFLCALFLVRYLKHAKEFRYREKVSRFYWDENLFLFAVSVAASIAIHFYVTIMAVFLCCSIAVFAIRKLFNRKRFVPLLAAVLCGLILAAVPMAGALASGIPFQGSIHWAVNVINGTGTEEGRFQQVEQDKSQIENHSMVQRGLHACGEKLVGTYKEGYHSLYDNRAKWIVACTGLAVVLWIAVQIIAVLQRRRSDFKIQIEKNRFDGYPGIIVASILFMFVYAAPLMGLPEIVEGSRLCSTEHFLILTVVAMPVDMIFSLLEEYRKNWERILQTASILCTMGIYAMSMIFGVYHGYLYYGLTRYNSAVMVTNSIIETLPQYSYTIVSTTDELYSVIEYGRHEELLTFVEKSRDEVEYTFPTEYVFIYIEKKPLKYGQIHFFKGPKWLAWEKYEKFFSGDSISRCPEIYSGEISEIAAHKGLLYVHPWDIYTNVDSRVIVESKAYEWCKRFAKLYPLDMKVYYEDDDFVCYYFRQETHAPYNLVIKE